MYLWPGSIVSSSGSLAAEGYFLEWSWLGCSFAFGVIAGSDLSDSCGWAATRAGIRTTNAPTVQMILTMLYSSRGEKFSIRDECTRPPRLRTRPAAQLERDSASFSYRFLERLPAPRSSRRALTSHSVDRPTRT